MKVKDLIKELKALDQEQSIKLACDEEWNTIFNDIEIAKDGEYGAFVLFGLSGSEEESYEDVANNKYDHNLGLCINCGGERALDQPSYCDKCLQAKSEGKTDNEIFYCRHCGDYCGESGICTMCVENGDK